MLATVLRGLLPVLRGLLPVGEAPRPLFAFSLHLRAFLDFRLDFLAALCSRQRSARGRLARLDLEMQKGAAVSFSSVFETEERGSWLIPACRMSDLLLDILATTQITNNRDKNRASTRVTMPTSQSASQVAVLF